VRIGKIKDRDYQQRLEQYYRDLEGHNDSMDRWQYDGSRSSRPPLAPRKPQEMVDAFAKIRIV